MRLINCYFYLIIIICLGACKSTIKNEQVDSTKEANIVKDTVVQNPAPKVPGSPIVSNENDMTGYWVGWFTPDTALEPLMVGERDAWDYRNKINICIDKIQGDSVTGHSVVGQQPAVCRCH